MNSQYTPYQNIRLEVVKEGTNHHVNCENSKDVYLEMSKITNKLDRECFYSIHLNIKNKIIGINLVSMGSLTSSIVHPREVFKAALLTNTVSVILCHNHPSGDPQPSKEDISITDRLIKAGDILGVKILDHIIIGDDNYYSFTDEGRI